MASSLSRFFRMALRELLCLVTVLSVCWGSGVESYMRPAPTSVVPGMYQSSVVPSRVPPTGLTPSAISVSPSGENVCRHEVLRSEWVSVEMTYACWQTEEVDRSYCRQPRTGRRECYWGRDWRPEWRRHRGKRQADGCYKLVLRTCKKSVMKLVSRQTTEYFCCSGFEVDASGRCYSSLSCSNNNGGCEHICTHDSNGNPRCACFPGYRMVGEKCVDLNECASNPCNHKCENTPGSFYCSCNAGYALISQTHCAETNECAIGNGGCQHYCTNTPGAFYCRCDNGFDLESGFQCEDTDECALHNGGCSHECSNQYGYYECVCPDNFYLMKDNKTCFSIEAEVDPPLFPPRDEVPGAEGRTGGEENSVSMALIVGPVAGLVGLLLVAVVGVCWWRRCARSHAGTQPPPPTIAIVSDNSYHDTAIAGALKKKKAVEAEQAFDNPGYGEKPSMPPSYTDHSYCYIKPPAYQETDKAPESDPIPIQPQPAAVRPEYDNAATEEKPLSVKKLLENFEKTPGTNEKSKKVDMTSTASGKERQYDNALNEMKNKVM